MTHPQKGFDGIKSYTNSSTSSIIPFNSIKRLCDNDTGGNLLAEQLIIRYKNAYDKPNATEFTVDQMYSVFTVSGFDFVGQSSHGFGAIGLGVGLSCSFSPGDMTLPGFVTAEIKVGGGIEAINETFIAVVRQPQSTHHKENPFRVCFISANGRHWNGSLNLSASLGLKASGKADASGQSSSMLTSKTDKDEQKKTAQEEFGKYGCMALEQLALSASNEISLSAEASIEGQFMNLTDTHPSWYHSWNDERLKQSFSEIVGYGTENNIKQRIKAFMGSYDGVLTGVFQHLNFWKTLKGFFTGGELPFEVLMASLINAQTLIFALRDLRVAGLDRELIKTLNDYNLDVARELDTFVLKRWLGNRNSENKTKTSLDDVFHYSNLSLLIPKDGFTGMPSLANWKIAIENAIKGLSLSTQDYHKILEEISFHIKVISYKKAQKIPTKDQVALGYENTLTFINLWGYKAGVGAGLKQAINLSASPVLSVALNAGVKVEAEKKCTVYRYQNYTPAAALDNETSQSELIATQDTDVSYVQTKLSGEALAKITIAGIDPIKKLSGKEAEVGGEDRIVNNLGYKSSTCYWQVPSQSSINKVNLMAGSGIHFAHSITQGSLYKICNREQGYSHLVAELANELRVSVRDLEHFLSQKEVVEICTSRLPVDALVIEVSFKASKGIECAIEWPKNKEHAPRLSHQAREIVFNSMDTAIKADAHRAIKEKQVLESIRLRYRIIDSLNSDSSFKLGIPYPIKLGINLTAVNRAEASGLVDLATVWFGESADSILAYPEDSVPAVTLIHQ